MIDVNCIHQQIEPWQDYSSASDLTDFILNQISQWFRVDFVQTHDEVPYPFREIWVLPYPDGYTELHFANQRIFYLLFPEPEHWFNFRETMNQRCGWTFFVEMHDDWIH